MASDVQVDITDRTVIQALNTPGGAIYEWRDDTAEAIIGTAIGLSPINDVLNTLRPGHAPPGGYIASWGFDRVGSNGHTVRATIFNGSDHADIVEFGRFPSSGRETFSWAGHRPPGAVDTHDFGTSGRVGKHVLRDATNARGAATGDYGPLS